MAGTGPAPKAPEARRNRTPPARGEWVDLAPLEKLFLPALPKRAKGMGSWSGRTRSAWAAWRKDPVTSQYGPADVQAALDLAFVYEDWVRGGKVADEIRQRQDRLGLNPKGKRDLRWRLKADAEVVSFQQPKRSRTDRRARLERVK